MKLFSFNLFISDEHTYTHAHIHTYTNTHIHTYTHTHIHTYTHRHTQTHIHTHIDTHIYTRAKGIGREHDDVDGVSVTAERPRNEACYHQQ